MSGSFRFRSDSFKRNGVFGNTKDYCRFKLSLCSVQKSIKRCIELQEYFILIDESQQWLSGNFKCVSHLTFKMLS